LPDGFQRAEYLVEKGMVDRVVHRQEMTLILSALISMLMGGQNYDRS
jgi:acetyl-CoA carboxylase carboxyl transferase subunit beta